MNLTDNLLKAAIKIGIVTVDMLKQLVTKILEVDKMDPAEVEKKVDEIVTEIFRILKERKMHANDIIEQVKTIIEEKGLKLKAGFLAELHDFAVALAKATYTEEQPAEEKKPKEPRVSKKMAASAVKKASRASGAKGK